MKRIGVKALRKALSAAYFDPRKPSTMTAICQTQDVSYLLERAQEQLRVAKNFSGIERWAKIRDAVAILAYAMCLDGS